MLICMILAITYRENRHLLLNMILFSKTSSRITQETQDLCGSLYCWLFFFMYNSLLGKNAI